MRIGADVRGPTTAASIWLTAAVGMAAGAGLSIMSGITTIAAVALMHFLTRPR